MGKAHFRTSTPLETPQPISMSRQIYYYVPQGVDVQNLVGIDSAVTDLRMREKNTFCVDFLLTYLSLYLSIYLSIILSVRFFVAITGHSFGVDFYA